MGWTKRDLVQHAFEEIGLASYIFDLEPEQLQHAMRRLDVMMGSWDGKGIRLGYPIPTEPDGGDLDDNSNLPDDAIETVIANLAVRLAPGLGKVVSPDTKTAARVGYQTLISRTAQPVEMQTGVIPYGQGHKRRKNSGWKSDAEDPNLSTGGDGYIDLYT